jgi:hypothetical protein
LAYHIVSIGKVFTDKTREALTQQLNAHEEQGWEFHSVFGVSERTGCLGTNTSETLYMVLKSRR